MGSCNEQEDFNCAKCKCLPNEAFMAPCGCRLCRPCIDILIESGLKFCPGVTADCGEALLSHSVTDYRANKKISRLTGKCPNDGCTHICRLAEMEDHLRVCPNKNGECPFGQLGCKHGRLSADEMEAHLRQEGRSHSEILIGMIVNINNEMEANRTELERLRRDLLAKDEQMTRIMGENDSIKAENAVLADRVRMLAEEIDRGGENRRDRAAPDRSWASKHVVMEMDDGDGGSVTRSDVDFVQVQLQSLQALLGRADAHYEWLIEPDGREASGCFTGTVHPYRFQLACLWSRGGGGKSLLKVHLRVYDGEHDALLVWPFLGTVTIAVADREKPESSRSVTLKCQIQRPPQNRYQYSQPFGFLRKTLAEAGINPDQGLCVSCYVLPGWDPACLCAQGAD